MSAIGNGVNSSDRECVLAKRLPLVPGSRWGMAFALALESMAGLGWDLDWAYWWTTVAGSAVVWALATVPVCRRLLRQPPAQLS